MILNDDHWRLLRVLEPDLNLRMSPEFQFCSTLRVGDRTINYKSGSIPKESDIAQAQELAGSHDNTEQCVDKNHTVICIFYQILVWFETSHVPNSPDKAPKDQPAMKANLHDPTQVSSTIKDMQVTVSSSKHVPNKQKSWQNCSQKVLCCCCDVCMPVRMCLQRLSCTCLWLCSATYLTAVNEKFGGKKSTSTTTPTTKL